MIKNIKYSSLFISLTETDKKTGMSKTIEKNWLKFPDNPIDGLSAILAGFLYKKSRKEDDKTFKEYNKYCYSWEENDKTYLNYVMGFVALPDEGGFILENV